MITIITSKRWKRLQADNERMREELARYDDVVKNLVSRVAKLEKAVSAAKKDSRATKADVKKILKTKE